MLLANHGPVVAGTSLSAAAGAIEELEETARLHLLLQGHHTRYLTPEQVAELRARPGELVEEGAELVTFAGHAPGA